MSNFAASKQDTEVVSSSSLVRTSGFHPGNSGSNPGETTKTNPNSFKIRVRVFLLRHSCLAQANNVNAAQKQKEAMLTRLPCFLSGNCWTRTNDPRLVRAML